MRSHDQPEGAIWGGPAKISHGFLHMEREDFILVLKFWTVMIKKPLEKISNYFSQTWSRWFRTIFWRINTHQQWLCLYIQLSCWKQTFWDRIRSKWDTRTNKWWQTYWRNKPSRSGGKLWRIFVQLTITYWRNQSQNCKEKYFLTLWKLHTSENFLYILNKISKTAANLTDWTQRF